MKEREKEMKAIRCEDCNALIWDKKVVKMFYKFKLNNICPRCGHYGALKRVKIKRRDR